MQRCNRSRSKCNVTKRKERLSYGKETSCSYALELSLERQNIILE